GAARDFDMEHAPALDPVAPRGLAKGLAAIQEAGAVTSSYFTWSKPLARDTRITGTPNISFKAKGSGNVMLKLYDVGTDGKAVMFDEQVSLVKSGRVSVDLKATDWTLKAGHVLGVEVGSIQSGSWQDTPSGETIGVDDARLALALDDPADDVATAGDRSPFLDSYLRQYTTTLAAGEGSFTLPRA
ncbi:CocE/NonD family hydrolase, partial [Streptomyces sp. SID11233]|nr:CocE/NonD family hydrolase [Streptomyces sp. SID11233]